MISFGSVCSGIEAASVAWHPIGWQAAWLAEIEPFPCAVLAHHYPNTPNLGDMTKIAKRVLSGDVLAPDVLCGGTPCQAFSVAGLRKSLDDERGNLTLKFVELADAIDHVRAMRGEPPAVVVWENVPGVLSTKDNAFGCFLAGLAGEADPLLPPGGKWTDAGAVFGPQRAVAWRVLDAQYFGLAQRRRRVFVVASARDGFDPAAVLFERDGVRRDTAPRRKAQQGAAGGAALSVALLGRDGGATAELGDDQAGCLRASGGGGDKPHVLAPTAFGGNNQSGSIDVATARNACASARASASGRMDFESETFLVQPVAFHPTQDPISSTDCTKHAMGCGSSGGQASVAVAFAIQAGALRTNPNSGPDGIGVQSDHAYTLEARAEVQAVAFHPTQDPISSTDGTTHAMGCGSSGGQASVAVAFSAKDYGADACRDISPTLRAMNHASSHANGGGQMAVAVIGDISHALNTANNGKGSSEDGTGRGVPTIAQSMQVRRLTPTECERLQGFPDGYTAIPWRKKPASECPDGPRYKALGNSWAVPVVRWIGARIDMQLKGGFMSRRRDLGFDLHDGVFLALSLLDLAGGSLSLKDMHQLLSEGRGPETLTVKALASPMSGGAMAWGAGDPVTVSITDLGRALLCGPEICPDAAEPSEMLTIVQSVHVRIMRVMVCREACQACELRELVCGHAQTRRAGSSPEKWFGRHTRELFRCGWLEWVERTGMANGVIRATSDGVALSMRLPEFSA